MARDMDSVVRRIIREELAVLRGGEPGETTPSLLTVAEAAEHLRVSENAIRTWLRGKRIPSYRIGRLVRVRRADLDAFIKAQL